jgi:hypothetical protein
MTLANLHNPLANPARCPNPERLQKPLKQVVRAAGLEPAREFSQRILSPPFNGCNQKLGFRSLATLPPSTNNLRREVANLSRPLSCQGNRLPKTTAKQRISNAFDRPTFAIGCYGPWATMGGERS